VLLLLSWQLVGHCAKDIEEEDNQPTGSIELPRPIASQLLSQYVQELSR
jgi:hypothetical protein